MRTAIAPRYPYPNVTIDGWRDEALCAPGRASDPDLWFVDAIGASGRRQAAAAKTICRECPARAACLEYAMSLPANPDGVFGGMTREERARARRSAAVGMAS